MLLLTRKADQIITIGDDIKVKIIKINGNQVMIGIEAPKNVSIHREEIYNKILAQQEHQHEAA